ncbi:MAG: ECF transporter S component [Clostridia bacterium]|nr:ECF transporter S component [Clostridia bacterium]
MKNLKLLKITYAAFFLCLALVLPFLTGQIKIFGKMLNLMHVAIFLCGLVCDWKHGLAVGFIAPILRSLLFGMPVLYPNAVAMAFELGMYGFTAGFLYERLYNKRAGVYISLVSAMLAGRAVWGIASAFVWSIMGELFTIVMFVKGAFIDSVVGIVVQLIIIPIIVGVLKKANLLLISKDTKKSTTDCE